MCLRCSLVGGPRGALGSGGTALGFGDFGKGVTVGVLDLGPGGFDIAGGEVDSNRPGSGIVNHRVYVMNIAMDLRLVQTTTLEVVDVVSYQKQIVGREISAGIFDFLDGNVFDFSAGEGGLEIGKVRVH